MFDQWFPRRVQAKQLDMLREGVAPHVHGDFQRHLISTARGLLNTNLLDELRGTAGPGASTPPNPGRPNPNSAPLDPKTCAYYLGDHKKTSHHPADKLITEPCPECRHPHALVGELANPAPPVLPRTSDKSGCGARGATATQILPPPPKFTAIRSVAAQIRHRPRPRGHTDPHGRGERPHPCIHAAYADMMDVPDCMPIYSTDGTGYQKLIHSLPSWLPDLV